LHLLKDSVGHVLIPFQHINPGVVAIIKLSKENREMWWQKRPKNLLDTPMRFFFFKESLTFISFFLNTGWDLFIETALARMEP